MTTSLRLSAFRLVYKRNYANKAPMNVNKPMFILKILSETRLQPATGLTPGWVRLLRIYTKSREHNYVNTLSEASSTTLASPQATASPPLASWTPISRVSNRAVSASKRDPHTGWLSPSCTTPLVPYPVPRAETDSSSSRNSTSSISSGSSSSRSRSRSSSSSSSSSSSNSSSNSSSGG